MLKRTGWGFAVIALILAGCIYSLYSGKFNLGIDLRGGTELVYELDLSSVPEEESSVAEEVKRTVATRLDIYGLKEISIAVQGTNNLVIQVPGASDSQDVAQIKRQIEDAGNLLFMLVDPEDEHGPERIKEIREEEERYLAAYRAWVQRKREHDARYRAQGQEPPKFEESVEKPPPEPEFIARAEIETEEVQGRVIVKETATRVLHNGEDYKVSGKHLVRAHETYDENGRPAVAFTFNQEGANKFANLTGAHVNRLLAIMLDDKIRQVATIKSRIYDTGQLTGTFTRQEVRSIVTLLKGGALPTRPKLISESRVGAVLGSDSVKNGSLAVLVGLAGILLFLGIYYLAGGMVANLALVFNVVIILAFVVVFRQALTFPGIAGIILTLAMSIDANILIFERMREELARGKSLLHSMTAGYQRAFWVIFDSNLTTILTGVVLFEFGTGPVKGFAVTLIAGLVASFFTAVFVTRVILSFLYNVGILKSMHMLKIFSPPRVDYVSIRRWFVGASLVIIAGTWFFFVFPRGSANYGIDFTGGSRITMNLTRYIDVGRLRELVDNLPPGDRELFKDYSIQTLDAQGERASSFSLLTRTEEEERVVARAQEKPAPEKSALVPDDLEEERGTPESRRVEVLKRMLVRENLLLPEAFSLPAWEDAPPPPGAQRLILQANLIRIYPALNEVPDAQGRPRTLPAEEALKERLNRHFETHRNPLFAGGAAPDSPRGIRMEKVEPVPSPVVEGSAEQSVKLASFRITTVPYVDPGPAAPMADRKAPRHEEVVTEIKDWFRRTASNLVRISEPIPEVFSVGPKVAQGLQASAIIAVFISMIGIMFYMALRFELMYGIAGIAALAHDVLITIGIMAMTDALIGQTFSAKINLPEIAAFLTIIGFSINDTIVVFDRVRELLRTTSKRKLEYREVVNAAVNQTMSRTIWTSLTTLVVTVALLLFGGEPIRGFSYAFAIGVVAGCYSTVFIASPIVVYLHQRQLRRREQLLAEAARA